MFSYEIIQWGPSVQTVCCRRPSVHTRRSNTLHTQPVCWLERSNFIRIEGCWDVEMLSIWGRNIQLIHLHIINSSRRKRNLVTISVSQPLISCRAGIVFTGPTLYQKCVAPVLSISTEILYDVHSLLSDKFVSTIYTGRLGRQRWLDRTWNRWKSFEICQCQSLVGS